MNNKKLLFIIPLVVFVGLIVMLGARLGKSSDIVVSSAMNKPLPEFSLPLLHNLEKTQSNQDLPKTPFILNVWGSWCPTCRVEHPFLMKLHKEGVPMVGVNYKDEIKDALGYLHEFEDPFLYSVQDYQGTLALDLGLMGAPESFIVDSKGVVRLHIVGEIYEKNWQEQIKPCLDALATNDQAAQAKACVMKGA